MVASVSIKTGQFDAWVQQIKREKRMRSQDITQAMTDALMLVERRAQTHLRGGNPLHKRTGALSAAVAISVKKERKNIHRGKVGVFGADATAKGPGMYGRVQEFGVQTPGHVIRPKRPGGVLAWRASYKFTRSKKAGPLFGGYSLKRTMKHGKGTGHWIFAKKVKLPPKPWLRPSLDEALPNMKRILAKAGLVLTRKSRGPR